MTSRVRRVTSGTRPGDPTGRRPRRSRALTAALPALLLLLTACTPQASSPAPRTTFPTVTVPAVTTPPGGVTVVSTSCEPNAVGAGAGRPITGTVYYDKNENGEQDRGEPGLPGIPVYLSGGADSMTPGAEKAASSCTGAGGRYTLIPPDTYNGLRVYFRTGWFRSQCKGLTCAPGGPGNNVAAGPEWIYSTPVTGAKAHRFNVGLIPDAGQYVVDIHSKNYSKYPPAMSAAHPVDLSARFTDDETTNCRTTTNGVSCHIGQSMGQTLYIANSGLTPVSGIKAVMQLPWGEKHETLKLLRTGSSPTVTGLSDVRVTPAKAPRARGHAATADNYTTIAFGIRGTVPPAGLIAVLSVDTLAEGTPGTQIIGHAGVTAEDGAASDHDSAFCSAPVLPQECPSIANSHSLLDLDGDDNDSDRFNVLAP
jgi:hypothetical protein